MERMDSRTKSRQLQQWYAQDVGFDKIMASVVDSEKRLGEGKVAESERRKRKWMGLDDDGEEAAEEAGQVVEYDRGYLYHRPGRQFTFTRTILDQDRSLKSKKFLAEVSCAALLIFRVRFTI
ncbi:unnamed protein product [Zymoseptoria tritici ST99CH_1A5]|uniref:Uncharacterized protein n=1 Tax=Zymoseptoria tritici ST99CH_1A5 TaxID=1276529 RepID=A0A1Y6LYT8_ZYMTR|nr:unnamed protein product [Zymoseptoria tritici ST99CH_1A5]